MQRRDFLRALLLLPSLPSLPSLALPFWPASALAQDKHDSKPKRFIDAHCHIFNANDLPIENFVVKVMLPDLLGSLKRRRTSKLLVKLFQSHAKAEAAFISLLARVMRNAAPDSATELAEISKNGHTLTQNELIKRRRDKEVKILTELLEVVWNPQPGSEYFVPTVLNEIRARIRMEAMDLTKPADAYADPQTDIGSLGLIADNLYYDRKPNADKSIGFMLRWALRFGRYHFELVDELSNMYSERLRLATPAFVDFDFWLEKPNWTADKATRQFQLQQIEVMAAIARRPRGPRTHGFMSFDPLRHAFFVQRKKSGQISGKSPLEIVQAAIANGFIGVKLYPAMGFRPVNNRYISFPDYVTDKSTGLGASAGAEIDAALEELYAWCDANEVPIVAHANNSNESRMDYGARGSPDNWRKLIKSNKFKNLRINLAHFGGFEELFFNPIGDEKLEETWEWKVLQIWKEFPEAMLYADISYLNEVLPLKSPADKSAKKAHQETRRRIVKVWRQHVQPAPLSSMRLMYGSDWMMLGGQIGFPSFAPWNPQPTKFYPDYVAEFLDEVGFKSEEIDRILFKNAVDFLGLGSTNRNGTRGRLEAFYGPANSAWLAEFD